MSLSHQTTAKQMKESRKNLFKEVWRTEALILSGIFDDGWQNEYYR